MFLLTLIAVNHYFSQRQKVSDEKNVARIHKEMQKVQQQMNVTIDEYNRVAGVNVNIRETLVNEQEKTFKMEESLKVGQLYYSFHYFLDFTLFKEV